MDSPSTSYSDAKVLFVSNNLGTSLTRVNAISIVSIASYALFASIVRYSAAVQAAGRPYSSSGLLERWAMDLNTWHQQRQPEDKWQASAIVAAESVIFIIPLLLSITILSGTYQATALSLSLFCVSAGLHYLSRHTHPRTTRERRLSQDESSTDEATALRSASNTREARDGLRNRKALSNQPHHRREFSQSSKSYSESDDDELEEELIEKRSSRLTSNLSDSTQVRVSVESASDQAWNAANPPERWVEPENRAERAASFGPYVKEQTRIAGVANRADHAVRQHDHFLTVYRSHMMLITIACILAVDFPVFARELGKCETWGASLMDLGVGSFVFSLGIVSAGPYLKPTRPTLLSLLRKDVSKSLPLFALGMIRVVTVKLTKYPEHVTEYGVHWNFFLTLATLPLLKTGVEAIRRLVGGRWSTWGLTIGFLHQALLTMTPLQSYILSSTPREESLLAANREGIHSLPGYLSLLLLSIDLGLYILPPNDPYQAFRRVPLEEVERNRHARTGSDGSIDVKALQSQGKKREGKRLASLTAVLFSWALIYWTLYFFFAFTLSFVHPDAPRDERGQRLLTTLTLTVSRRLANLPYLLWVAGFNVSFLSAYTTVYWLLLHPVKWIPFSDASQHLHLHHHQDDPTKFQVLSEDLNASRTSPSSSSPSSPHFPPLTPHLLTILNDTSFHVFLLSNLLTGLVNLTMKTMYTRDGLALLVLAGYMFVLVIGGPLWIFPLVRVCWRERDGRTR